MCGITAIIGNNLKSNPQILELLHHRGPDDSAILINDHSALYHSRLSIVDLSSGKQPIQGTYEAYVIHNGEIYNHQKLRDTLLKGRTFRTPH